MALKHYAVIGDPIAHSKSPEIHQAFAQQLGLELDYQKVRVTSGEFNAWIQEFRNRGGLGLNITLPHKPAAYSYAELLSERAKPTGAVNTLCFASGKAYGDNTDGPGLVRDLTVNLGLVLRGTDILLLGAGGAARGILGALLAEQPSSLCIANRTLDKAQALAAWPGYAQVTARALEALGESRYHLVINATSASLTQAALQLPADILHPGAAVYDLVYAKTPTAFLRWGQAQGAVLHADGLGMLVEQAAEACLVWHGRRPETGPVIRAIRARLR